MTDEQQDAIREAFNEWVDQVGLDPTRWSLSIGALESIFKGGFGYPIIASFGERHGKVVLDPGWLSARELPELAADLIHTIMLGLIKSVVDPNG